MKRLGLFAACGERSAEIPRLQNQRRLNLRSRSSGVGRASPRFGRATAGFAAPLLGLCALFGSPGCASDGQNIRVRGLSDARDLEFTFRSVIDQVLPSVAGVRTERITRVPVDGRASSASYIEQRTIVNGTAMVVSQDGLFLTNEHVVHDASEVTLILSDGRRAPARVVAADVRGDLAILSAPLAGLMPVQFAQASVGPQRGEWSIAIGNPFGIGQDGRLSASIGVVSNVSRSLPGLGAADDRQYRDMIQTTAPIHPGNSGGPLFNLEGEVIGIVTAMFSRSSDDEGMAFAIPLTQPVREKIALLQRGETIAYGYLGLGLRDVDADSAERAGMGKASGALICALEDDGPADRAGLRVGDVVVSYNTRKIEDAEQLLDAVTASAARSIANVLIWREGRVCEVRVRAERREPARVLALRM